MGGDSLPQADDDAPYRFRRLAGRLANGFERDAGRVVHVLENYGGHALCGAKPGPRSAGWSEHDEDLPTCKRCISKGRVP